MRFRLLSSLACGFLLGGGAVAQTLQDAMVSAYRDNPQLEADRARQRGADEDVARAWGGYRPQVVLSGQTGRAHDHAWIPESNILGQSSVVQEKVLRDPNQEVVQLKQEIWDGNRTIADVTHAKWAVANGRALLISTEQSVLGGAVQSYYDLYRDQRIYEIQRDFLASLAEERKAALKRYAVKDVTQTDVAQAEARYARGDADLKQYLGQLETSRSAFQLATGLQPGDRLPDPPALPLALLPQTIDDALAQIEENPDLQATIYAEKAAESDIELAESAMMPDVSLQALGTHTQHTDYTGTQLTTGEVLLNVTFPLYDGGVASARTRGAKHILGQRKLTTDLQRIRTRDAIRRAWEGLQATRARIAALQENIRADEVALKGVQQELKVGSRTEIDELNAQQELYDAKIGLLRSEHDLAVSAYSLLLAVGRLTAGNLNLPVDIYDPNDHYESVSWMPWGPWIDKDYPKHADVPESKLPGGKPYPTLNDLPDLPDWLDPARIKFPYIND